MASMNTARVDSRCRMNPVVGITTAMVSMKPVDSHCTVGASTLQVHHQPLQGDVHDGLVEDHHERGHQQRDDDGHGLPGHLRRRGCRGRPRRGRRSRPGMAGAPRRGPP